MSKKITYYSIKIAQVIFIICAIVFNIHGQYTDQLNITPNKDEYTFNYNWERTNLVSITAVGDSLLDSTGYAAYEFKQYDANFNVTLLKRYVDTNYIYGFGRSMTYNNGCYYVGGFKDSAYYQNDTTTAFLLKFDTLGNLIWEKKYYSSFIKSDIKFVLGHDSLIVFSGHTKDSSQPITNQLTTFFTAIDTSGTVIWERFFTGYNLQPVNLKATSDGGFLLTGYTQVTGAYNTRVYKLDHLGNTSWVRSIGNGTDSYLMGAEEAPDGTIICYGWKTVNNFETSYLVKLSNGGTILSDTLYDFAPQPGYRDYFNPEGDVVFASNGVYIYGYYKSMPSVFEQTYLVFVNYNLELQWVRFFGIRTYNDLVTYLLPYPPNPDYLAMCGISFSDSTSNTNDEWFLVVDSLGCTVQGCSVGITEEELSNQQVSVYPNPSNGSFTLNLQGSENDGQYSITITDLRGAVVHSQNLRSPTTEIELQQPPGIYLVHLLHNGERVQTQKLVLIE